jgi:cell division protein FtsI (penicillin-binding protein 3)
LIVPDQWHTLKTMPKAASIPSSLSSSQKKAGGVKQLGQTSADGSGEGSGEGSGYGDYYAASFFGMAPVDNPQYAMGVVIYKPKRVWTNSMAAAASYQKILSNVLLANRVQPSSGTSLDLPTQW